MRIRLVLGTLYLALSVAACGSSEPNLSHEQDAVLTAERNWAMAAKQRDLDRSVSFMADDAVTFPPGSPVIVGQTAIREYMAAGFATPGFSVTWEPEEVVVADGGDLAYTRSRSVYTLPGPDGQTQTVHAKGVAIWRKSAEGEWRCVVDIWNDAPPPAQLGPRKVSTSLRQQGVRI
ncbi:MAG: YybH family protein [Thermoanaerobaculia bacterium]